MPHAPYGWRAPLPPPIDLIDTRLKYVQIAYRISDQVHYNLMIVPSIIAGVSREVAVRVA